METTQDHKYVISNLVQILHDAPSAKNSEGKTQILEAYFNDIYKLFLAKLAKFEAAPSIVDADKTKLRSLLDELVNVKGLLVD